MNPITIAFMTIAAVASIATITFVVLAMLEDRRYTYGR